MVITTVSSLYASLLLLSTPNLFPLETSAQTHYEALSFPNTLSTIPTPTLS